MPLINACGALEVMRSYQIRAGLTDIMIEQNGADGMNDVERFVHLGAGRSNVQAALDDLRRIAAMAIVDGEGDRTRPMAGCAIMRRG
jgi:hypothetical protein